MNHESTSMLRFAVQRQIKCAAATIHSHLLNGNECRSGRLAEEGLDRIFNECQTVSVESSAGFDNGKNHTHVLAS